MLELVAANVAVVEALGERSAVIVGHDWGATIAATSALARPEVFRAVGPLSVPYTLDASTTWLADAIEAYPATLPG